MLVIVLIALLTPMVLSETTDECSKVTPSFDVVDWMFQINDPVSKYLNEERLTNPMVFHSHRDQLLLISLYLEKQLSTSDWENSDTFYVKYVKNYPSMIRKLSCGMLGPAINLLELNSINYSDLYKSIVKSEGAWEFLTALNLKNPQMLLSQQQYQVSVAILNIMSKVSTNDPLLSTVYAGLPEYLYTMAMYTLESMVPNVKSEF